MQEKEQKISPVKQRILQFASTLGCSKRDFYRQIDVSRGTLESSTGVTEEVVTKFIATFPDVNIEWLWTGNGFMTIPKEDFTTMQEKEQNSYSNFDKLLNIVQQQAETIGEQRREIAELKRILGKNAELAASDKSAHAG